MNGVGIGIGGGSSSSSKEVLKPGNMDAEVDVDVNADVNVDVDAGMPPPEKKHRSTSREFRKSKAGNGVNGNARNKIRTIEQEYDLREEIGSGTCGQVRRAIHRSTGVEVAVKIIALGTKLGGRNRKFGVSMESGGGVGVGGVSILDPTIRAEASILQALDHPYIVKLLDLFIHPGQAVYLVMELLHGGDLFDRIVQKGRYSEIESRRVTRRMFAAVHYLHQDRDIVHRDLKPENILCLSRSDDVAVKLTDFGLAKSITDDGLKTFCGTPLYFAPEVLRRRNTVAGRGRYGKQADMWSLGVILYILICGAPPFDPNSSVDDTAAASGISFNGSIWDSTSDDAKDLVMKLLTPEPTKRIGIVDACSHQWINTADGDSHIHPLDDPVILEMAGKPSEAKIDKNSSTPARTQSSPAAPQSILSSGSEGSDVVKIQNATVTEIADEEIDNSDGRRRETISPNQSANFPTPLKTHAATNPNQPKREPIFSIVKQISNEGSDHRSEVENENDKILNGISDDEKDGKVKAEDLEARKQFSTNKSSSKSISNQVQSPRAKAISKNQQKQKGKQTTLSSFFDKR